MIKTTIGPSLIFAQVKVDLIYIIKQDSYSRRNIGQHWLFSRKTATTSE